MPVILTQSLLDGLFAEATSAISHPPMQYVGVDPRVLVALVEVASNRSTEPVGEPTTGAGSLIRKEVLL